MAINFRPVGAVNKEILQEPSFLQDLGADIKQTFQGVKNVAQQTMQKQTQAFGASQPLSSKLTQSIGIGAGGASGIFGEVLKGGVKAVLPQAQEQQLKSGVQSAVAPIVQSKPVQNLIQKYESLDENTKRDVDSLLGIGSFVADITGLGLGAKGVQKGTQLGVQAGKEALEAVTPTVTRATQKLKEVAKREVTPETALKETLQAKPMTEAQLKSGIETIKQLDTTKVKTFQDLDNVITERIGTLAKQVDDELGKDATKYNLTDLVTTKKTKAGTPIQMNFVDDALNQLDELYGATGDVVAQQDIKDLINIAKTQGLTRLEVNDIARTYGKEVGDKAFNKMGDPLTSVNAQRFENTRKGLKDVARQGVEGTAAKQADEAMSRLYNVQRLIKKNAERANALKNKIEERGLLEKVGHGITKYADVLTGGTIRGIVSGLLPRGAGYKTLNAIDLEELLTRNLKIIQEAGNKTKASEVKATLKKLDEPVKKKFDPTKQGGFVRIGKETPKTVDNNFEKVYHAGKLEGGIKDGIFTTPNKVDAETYFKNRGGKINEFLVDKSKLKLATPEFYSFAADEGRASMAQIAKDMKAKGFNAFRHGNGDLIIFDKSLLKQSPTLPKSKVNEFKTPDAIKGFVDDFLSREGGTPNKQGGFIRIGKETPKTEGNYLYHGTNESVLDSITQEGLRPGMRKQLSLSKTEDYAKSFAIEGKTPKGKTEKVMLRVNKDYLEGKTTTKRLDGKTRAQSDVLNELLTKETIPPEYLEIYKEGKWQPLKSKVNESVSSLNDTTLIKEAKKYKSAEEFVKAKFSQKPEYGMGHRPSYEDMPPAHNLLEGETLPRDVYTHPDYSISSGRIRSGDKSANESWAVLQKIKDNPNMEINVYRAGRSDKLNIGDWVTFSKNYAKESLEGNIEKVRAYKVKAKDIIFAGDDINEFGYYPKSQLKDIWDKANKK
jgi:hypothetical protein